MRDGDWTETDWFHSETGFPALKRLFVKRQALTSCNPTLRPAFGPYLGPNFQYENRVTFDRNSSSPSPNAAMDLKYLAPWHLLPARVALSSGGAASASGHFDVLIDPKEISGVVLPLDGS